jgi:hypothetical protein
VTVDVASNCRQGESQRRWRVVSDSFGLADPTSPTTRDVSLNVIFDYTYTNYRPGRDREGGIPSATTLQPSSPAIQKHHPAIDSR